MAAADPDSIREMIKDNGDGTFTVRFFPASFAPWVEDEVVQITVDTDLPVNKDGELAYGKPTDTPYGPELWAIIIEKAFAKWGVSARTRSGPPGEGYNSIAEGGGMATVSAMMTGKKYRDYQIPLFLSNQELFDTVKASFDGGLPITLSAKKRLVRNHAYAVVAVNDGIGSGTEPTITLRNPWGNWQDGYDWRGEGQFTLTLSELAAAFDYIALPVEKRPSMGLSRIWKFAKRELSR